MLLQHAKARMWCLGLAVSVSRPSRDILSDSFWSRLKDLVHLRVKNYGLIQTVLLS